MKQVTTTLVLSIFALASLTTALVVHYRTQPSTDAQSELIGEPFYPAFTDPRQAASLKLTVWEEDDSRDFEIKKEDDLWTIPAYYSYPVESSEQLNETAGSVINIEREFLAGTAQNLHERFGVVDPRDPEAKLNEANQIGDRITLTDDSGNVVFDLIVGNEVDAEAENEIAQERELVAGNRYYVRQPNQNETFVATLNLQISTEFEDWIDSDLLKVEDAAVTNIESQSYEIEVKEIKLPNGRTAPVPVRSNFEELNLNKDGFAWKLDGLNEETEEFQSQPVNELEQQLQNLKVIGVEPKPTYQDGETLVLNPDLTVNLPPGASRNDMEFVQRDASRLLSRQGFILGLVDETNLENVVLLSENGELTFGTDDGLVYHLVFGSGVTMEGDAFSFAGSEDDEKATAEDGEPESDPASDGDATQDDSQKGSSSEKKTGKIMSVHVTFDPALIEKPTEPIKPIKPIQPQMPKAADAEAKDDPGSTQKNEGKKGNDDSKTDKDSPQPDSKSSDELKSKSESNLSNEDKEDKEGVEPKPAGKDGASDAKKEPLNEKSDSKVSECGVESWNGDEEPSFVVSRVQEQESKKQESDKPKSEPQNAENSEPGKQEPGKQEPGKQEPGKQEPGKQEPSKQAPKKQEGAADVDSESKQDSSEKASSTTPTGEANTNQETESETPSLNQDQQKFIQEITQYQRALQQYQSDLQNYEQQMEQYEKDLSEYERKVEDNRKKVEQLNSRFADWFYIVDAENLAEIKLQRDSLVTAKEKPADESAPNANPLRLPGAQDLPPNLNLPDLTPQPKPGKATKETPKGDNESPESAKGPSSNNSKSVGEGAAKKAASPKEGKRPKDPSGSEEQPSTEASEGGKKPSSSRPDENVKEQGGSSAEDQPSATNSKSSESGKQKTEKSAGGTGEKSDDQK